jgi:hypothetical protein
VKTAVGFIHILAATLWLGSAFFYTLLLLPRLVLLDGSNQRVLASSLRRVMVPLLAVAAGGTIVSGIVMMVQLHPRHPGPLAHTLWGTALVVGTLCSLGALAIAFLVETRLRRKDGARRPEWMLRLAALALLVVALATMAVARYS